MRQLMIVSAILIASPIVGCSNDYEMKDSDKFEIFRYGYVGRDKLSGEPTGRMKLKKVLIDHNVESKRHTGGSDIDTQEFILLQTLKNSFHAYGILIGPRPGPDAGTTIGTASVEVKQWALPAPVYIPVVQISCGWVYLTGNDPRVQTNWVAAGAHGSKVVMQITHNDLAQPVHRFFFIEGTLGAYVESRIAGSPPPTRRDFTPAQINHYVDAGSDGALSEIQLVVPGSAAKAFLDSILPYVNASGAELMD